MVTSRGVGGTSVGLVSVAVVVHTDTVDTVLNGATVRVLAAFSFINVRRRLVPPLRLGEGVVVAVVVCCGAKPFDLSRNHDSLGMVMNFACLPRVMAA